MDINVLVKILSSDYIKPLKGFEIFSFECELFLKIAPIHKKQFTFEIMRKLNHEISIIKQSPFRTGAKPFEILK